MKERTFKVMIIWLMPFGFLLAISMRYNDFVKTGFLIPMLIALPIGMYLSYLIYIRGIDDGKLFELFENNKES